MPPPKPPLRGNSPVPPPALRTLPHPDICRAENIELAEFAECLVKFPETCRYFLRFGGGPLCHHPEWRKIVDRTRAEASPEPPPPPATA